MCEYFQENTLQIVIFNKVLTIKKRQKGIFCVSLHPYIKI